jgi:hypothetical protein
MWLNFTSLYDIELTFIPKKNEQDTADNYSLLIHTYSAFLHPVRLRATAILIKGGHVIDPKNNINELMDIAINGDKIVLVAKNIDPKTAKQVVNASWSVCYSGTG